MWFTIVVVLGVCSGNLVSTIAAHHDNANIKSCEEILPTDMCTQLQQLAADRRVPFHKAEVNMHANRAKGIKQPDQLYAAVIKFLSKFSDEEFHDETIISCEAVLPDYQCAKLTELAMNIKLTPYDVINGLVDVRIQGIKDKTKIYEKVQEYLNSVVECFTILDDEHCGAIKHIAVKEKVPFREVERILKQETSRGVSEKGRLYQKVMTYLKTADDEEVEEKKSKREPSVMKVCKTVVSQEECEELQFYASIMAVDESQILKGLVDAQLQGLSRSSDVIPKAKQFLEDISYCTFVMTPKMCDNLQSSAERSNVVYHKIRVFMNKKYDGGMKDSQKLYDLTNSFIKQSTQLNDEGGCVMPSGGNKCMVLLKSIMKCLSLKMFAWKGSLHPGAVNEAMKRACAVEGRNDLYKNTIAVLRCQMQCNDGRASKSCEKLSPCKQNVSSAQDKSPRDLIIGINEK